MAKAVILSVDDDAHVLNAIERDLRAHYKNNYRILKASSGKEALEAVRRLKQRAAAVALFLVDQRMPEMSGVEFLSEAMKFFPEARKVLLTAYADTEAAIQSINQIGLDYYLLKPWDPPEERLFPVLDDLLSEWTSSSVEPYEGIRIAGTLWSPPCHNIKDFLARNRIPYQWLDIERDDEARLLVEAVDFPEGRKLPVVFLPDGQVLIDPDLSDLAGRVGLQTKATTQFYDLVIVGAGPAGLGAAVYGASEGLKTVLIEKEATGGQAGTSSRIENYLGFPRGLSGVELAKRATDQARRLGAEIITAQEVTGVGLDGPYRTVHLRSGEELTCRALVIAVGVSVRRLNAEGVQQFTGAGVYYGAALTEAPHYRDQPVFVVGGANSAGQAAVYFSRYAGQVTMLVRAADLESSMSQYLVDQIKNTANIEVLLQHEIRQALGEQRLEQLRILNRVTGEECERPAAAMFVFVGATPHTDFLAGVVERDNDGYILAGPDLMHNGRRPRGWTLNRDPYFLETSAPGIFAAGDARHGAIRRVASAVGEGAIAVSLVHQYLRTV